MAAPTPAPPTYDQMLAAYDGDIASGEARAADPLTSALVPLELIRMYTERARLTGSYDDYARAEALMGRLEARFPRNDDICLARAQLDYSLHRLAKAKSRLDGCRSLAGGHKDAALRADLAFYSGRYREAGGIYRAIANQVGGPSAYVALALYANRTGGPAEAAAFMEAAEKRDHSASAVLSSWYALQRGLIELDRGRFAEARALFALAEQRFPGYWLNEEHFAEATALGGDTAAAKAIYEKVVRKTGLPEYLDALADIETAAGNAAAAKPMLDKAEAIYDERAKRFPEAIAGHALAHYLHSAPQPAKALALAEANYRNRPYGDSAISLAKAYLMNKRAADAARLLEGELAKGWDTAEAWQVLSLAAAGAGDKARAERAANEAALRNPHAARQYGFAY